MKRLLLIFMLVFIVSCGEIESPDPHKLYDEISQNVSLGEMYDMTDEMLEDTIGITSDLYDSAVYMTPGTGISPEELIIVKAADTNSAERVEELLQNRLAYIKKCAENYLIEEMPIIEKAVIRRDGLTVSLIVSSMSAEIVEIYN